MSILDAYINGLMELDFKDRFKAQFKTPCELRNTCKFYKKDAAICQDRGDGGYCGAFRRLKER